MFAGYKFLAEAVIFGLLPSLDHALVLSFSFADHLFPEGPPPFGVQGLGFRV